MLSRRGSQLMETAVALLCMVAACSGAPNGASSTGLPPGAPIRIASTPRLHVGVTQGDTTQMFARVVTPFLMPDGRLVVPDAGEHMIRIFGPDGTFERAMGREGKGPGEFSMLTDAWARGDTIEAFDSGTGRITRFLPDDSTQVVALAGSGLLAVPGPFGPGWVIGAIVGAGTGGRDGWALEQYGPDGARIRTITRVPGMLRISTPHLTGPGPLSPHQVFAIGGDRLYTGETLTPRLEVWRPDGTPADTIAWQPAPSPNPKDVFSHVIDSTEARWRRQPRGISPKIWASYPVPDHLSVFSDVLVDPDGFVWIRPYRPLQDALPLGGDLGGFGGTKPGGTWMIVAPTGGVVDSVTVPTDLQPEQITRDAVVGITRDSLGVESLGVYPLKRQPR